MSKREALAQIIAAHDAEWVGQGGREPHSDHYATLDAILAELREPDEGMLVAARDWSDRKYGKPIGNDAATGCLQAMLDAITTEKADE